MREKVRCEDSKGLPCVTRRSVEEAMKKLSQGWRVSLVDAMQIVMAVKLLHQEEPNVRYLQGDVVVVGDLHGSLGDLLHILDTHGLPGDRYQFIFNGDLVDRGNNGCEIVLLIFMLKLLTPSAVHINRGNHEDTAMTSGYGFLNEAIAKYNLQFYDAVMANFSWLPFAAVVNKETFVCHGGLFDGTIEELQAMPRQVHEMTKEQSVLCSDLLWSDPTESVNWTKHSTRGVGYHFGPGYTEGWIADNPGIKRIVRSHECVERGVAVHHNGLVWTVFSSSGYYQHNKGAVLLFRESDATGHPIPVTWKPVNLPVDRSENSAVWAPTGVHFQNVVPYGSEYFYGCIKTKQMIFSTMILEFRDQLVQELLGADPDKTGYVPIEVFRQFLYYRMEAFLSASSDYLQTDKYETTNGKYINYAYFLDDHLDRAAKSWFPWYTDLYNVLESSECATEDDFRRKYRHKHAKRRVREMFPEEYVSALQLERFFRYSNSRMKSVDGVEPELEVIEGDVLQLDWAVNRRTARLSAACPKLIEIVRTQTSAGQIHTTPSQLQQGVATPCLADDIAHHLNTSPTESITLSSIEELCRVTTA